MKRISIVFSPHEDDETFACGGTIIKKIREGNEIYIIFMTDGRNSHKTVLNIQENPTPEEVKIIRENEAKEVAKILGVKAENIIFLGFEDGTLKDNTPKANAKKFVKRYLIKLKPTEIFIPRVYDVHKDHSLTNTIVLSAVKDLRLDLDVYEYFTWANNEWIAWSNNEDEFQNILKNPNLIEINISDVINLKNKAISTYRSQVNILFSSQTKPIVDDTFLSNFKKPVEYFLKYRIQKGYKINSQKVQNNDR